jgi:predicted DNA-binding transcriptional regulator AlpA
MAKDDPDLEALLNSREVAELLRLSERTLERHRLAGTGPRYAALGRAIRYRRRDVLAFVEEHLRQSTSEARP